MVLVRFSGLTPALTAVTLIVTVQLALEFTPTVAPGSDPPLTVKDAAPAIGTGVNASVDVAGGGRHVPPVVTGAATVMPAGRLSVNPITLLNGDVLKLRTVTVSVDVPPVVIGVGAKDFSTRAPVCSVTLAENAAVLVTPCAVTSALIGMVLVTAPLEYALGLLATTSNWKLQLRLAGMVPPASVALLAVVDTVPAPHVVVALGVGAMEMATGSVSVSEALVSATPFGLVSVTVMRDVGAGSVVLPCRTVGLNALAPVTGRSAATVSVAEAACELLPCDEATAFGGMVLMNTPEAGETMSTCTVH